MLCTECCADIGPPSFRPPCLLALFRSLYLQAKQSPIIANSWAAILPASSESASIASRAQGRTQEGAAATISASLRGRRLARRAYKGPIEVKDDDEARDRADANQTATVMFRGGDVMYNPVTVHFIWVGDWSDAQKTVIRTFVDSISAGGKGVTGKQASPPCGAAQSSDHPQ